MTGSMPRLCLYCKYEGQGNSRAACVYIFNLLKNKPVLCFVIIVLLISVWYKFSRWAGCHLFKGPKCRDRHQKQTSSVNRWCGVWQWHYFMSTVFLLGESGCVRKSGRDGWWQDRPRGPLLSPAPCPVKGHWSFSRTCMPAAFVAPGLLRTADRFS